MLWKMPTIFFFAFICFSLLNKTKNIRSSAEHVLETEMLYYIFYGPPANIHLSFIYKETSSLVIFQNISTHHITLAPKSSVSEDGSSSRKKVMLF